MKYLKVSVIILLVSLLAVPCFAEVPKLIEYIGNLEKPNGSPYPQGIYDINFQICTDIDCTTSLWSEPHTVEISAKNKKDLDGGTSYEAAFSVTLGSVDPDNNPLDIIFDQDLYLRVTELTLGYDKTEQLTSVTSAVSAEYAMKVFDSETGQYESLQDITINEAENADTVDDIHASVTPEANKLLALDGDIEFPNSVLKTGHGRGLDADTVDGMHYNNNWPTTLSNIQSACTNDFHNIGGTDNVNDADPNPTNEIQTLSTSGNNITLSNGGGSVTAPYANNANTLDGNHASAFVSANPSVKYVCVQDCNYDGRRESICSEVPAGWGEAWCNQIVCHRDDFGYEGGHCLRYNFTTQYSNGNFSQSIHECPDHHLY